jgi:hypothetical protein
MSALAHAAGISSALSAFGVKHAGAWQQFGKDLRQQAIGDPAETLKQLRKGTLFKPGKGLLYKGLPRSAGEIAAALAWPIMGSVLLARNAPESTGGEVAGDFVARSVGSLVGAPLGGAVGQIGGGMLLAPVGQAVGRAFDSRNPGVASEE